MKGVTGSMNAEHCSPLLSVWYPHATAAQAMSSTNPSRQASSFETDSVSLIPGRRTRNAPLLLSLFLNVLLALGVVALGVLSFVGGRAPAPAPSTSLEPLVDRSREVCSGNGMRYAGTDACECDDCYKGPTCAVRVSEAHCVVQANSGTPYIFEEYWVAHPQAQTTVLPSYHIGYGAEVPRLHRAIRALHKMTGNAEVDGREVVIGVGSTELIAAALHALAPENATSGVKAGVWSQRPYYSGYASASQQFHSETFEWAVPPPPPGAVMPAAADDPPPRGTAARPIIELVTSPNNPTGHARTPAVARGAHASHILDLAYYWSRAAPVPMHVYTCASLMCMACVWHV